MFILPRARSRMIAGTLSSHGIQRGGLDTLRLLPKFKYTTLESRKEFVGHLYPYADYLLEIARGVNLDDYEYNGDVTYIEYIDNEDDPIQGETKTATFKNYETTDRTTGEVTKSKGKMFYFGGTVYELFNMKYGSSVDLHRYCDPTGDIDLVVYPPPLIHVRTSADDLLDALYMIPFHYKNEAQEDRLNPFYDNFSTFVYSRFLANAMKQKELLSKIPGILELDIDDIDMYHDIPQESKYPNLGYKTTQITGTNFWVVAFITENMYKIQLVCKVAPSNDEIDHIMELVISFPKDPNSMYNLNDSYRIPNTQTITIGSSTYEIQDMPALLNENIAAYKTRKEFIEPTSMYHEYRHKAYNHIARLLYLYELVYQNPRDFKLNEFPSIINLIPSKIDLVDPYYYKIIGDEFYIFKIDVRYLLNAYLSIVKQNLNYRKYSLTNKNYFVVNDTNQAEMKRIHDEFIERLFNDEIFPNDMFTFPEVSVATGGGRRTRLKRKTHKKSNKKHHTKRRKPRKNRITRKKTNHK